MTSKNFRVKPLFGRLVFFLILFVMASLALLRAAEEEARVLRFPAIYKDLVVFSYAGDLYSVPVSGGVARRLTSHPGYEAFARFSPDGQLIAFTGEYDGNREVFLMPAEGGIPVRLTYTPVLSRDDISDRMGPNNIVMGWTPDGQKIIFRSRMAEWNDFNGQLYLVPRDGGTPEQLPLPRGGFCSFSPDGQKLAFNRIFREFRTWKRYRGGMVDDIWIYDFKTKKTENITNNPASDIIPMWSGNKIYFLSDRDENKRFNLYVYNTETGETRKVTDFKDYDIKFPSLGPGAIVFENGGYLYKLDLASEKVNRIQVHIADDQVVARTELVKVADRISTWDIAPDGARAVFGARGEIFTVPAKNGNTRNLTGTSGVHERDVAWSPDGRWIAFISDKTGREEVYIVPQDGSGPAVQLTADGECYKYAPLWSPDSKKLLWSDRMFRLRYVDIEKKQVVEVAKSKFWEINDYTWSPDSAWIAFSDQAENGMQKVYIYNLNSKETIEITDSWYSSYSPCFSADGRYLFFVSDRDFSPVYSRTEWNHAYLNLSRIYLVTLTREVKSPFEPKSDEVKVAAAEVSAPEKPKIEKPVVAKPASEKLAVRVDKEGIKDRIVALPVEVSGYFGLTSVGDKLYYLKRSFGDRQTSLKVYDFNKLEEKDLGGVNGYVISADKKKMLVQQGRDFAIIDLPAGPIKIEDRLNLSGLEMWLDRKAEWAQIFDECWRQMKDFFYAPNMHGVDWEKVRAQYEPLARAVNHRADLTYVIGEMIGELNAGHTYVGGGDLPKVDRVNVGRLGARLERDKSGYYLIKKILAGQNWDRSLRSPLTEVGVNIKEGEYIIAVNGKPVTQVKDIYELLVNTAGRQVTLKVNSQPSDKGAREVVVVPIETENSLYYYNWVKKNMEYVARVTDGKVAYIHVPDMGVAGLNEFVKHFYPQVDKKALIIDVRGNGGGNVSPMLIERLARQAVMVDIARGSVPRPDPEALILGPKVCLINEFSASDGDIFPYRFKRLQLGKLVGKRTWGGVVGIRGTLPLVDGGYLNKPEFATYSLEGQWIIEGQGVEPDIYVDNDPAREYEGIDEQLNKAIELILEELKTKEPKLPAVPPYPKK
ncbi:MAG: PDZ domain-containing protein [Candidatus Saccharicenans sp.]|nr:PDZ domain-containing protein [Candidatus Saccharicenans sp.]